MKKQIFGFALIMMTVVPVRAWANEAQEIRIEASEYKFTVSRDSLKVMEPAVLTLVNKGKFTHEFESDLFFDGEARVESEGVTTIGDGIQELLIAPGKIVTVRFVPRRKGKIEFACRAEEPKDHLKEGMRGFITVQ